jgi:hypothetical protein
MGGIAAAAEAADGVAGAGLLPKPNFAQEVRTDANANKQVRKRLIGKTSKKTDDHSFRRTGVPQ